MQNRRCKKTACQEGAKHCPELLVPCPFPGNDGRRAWVNPTIFCAATHGIPPQKKLDSIAGDDILSRKELTRRDGRGA